MNRMTVRARLTALSIATGVLVASGLLVAGPASAVPVGDYASLQTEFNGSGTVTLTASISSPASELVLANGATQVLNLGAFNLNVHSIQMGTGASLTITGTTGTLTADASDLDPNGFYTDARAGIFVPQTSTLVISSGIVHALGGGQGSPGIGSQGHGSFGGPGSISITGGTVVATGQNLGAGIGGAAVLVAGAGSVSISGGNVTAIGGAKAAGIGGGWVSSLTSITISGGTVNATGHDGGAGIGGGQDGAAGAISISAGTITATALSGNSVGGAGIGSGAFSGFSSGAGSIAISGGTITANSAASSGAGIGSGYSNSPIDITISNATINSTSDEGAGIGGGGFNGATSGTITIDSGAFTIMSGGGAGIGSGGFGGAAGTITINGGTFTITSTGGGAPIGGGFVAASTSISLNAGSFDLVSETLAANIGSGASGGAGGTILIADGVVVSVWSDQATSVVGGNNGSANITINGRLTIIGGVLIAPTAGGGLTIGSTGVVRGSGDVSGASPIINNGSITGSLNVTATDVQVNNFLVTYTADPSVSYAGGTQRVYATSFANAELALADPVAGYDVQWFDAPVAGTLFTTLTTLSADITLFPAFTVSALAATGVELGVLLPIASVVLLLGALLVLRRRSAAAHTITG
jgi:hypothetical protein